MPRFIDERILIDDGCLNALEYGEETLYAGPGLPVPRVQERQTDLAVLVQIGVKSCPPVVREITEHGGIKGIRVRKRDLEAEGPAVIRGVVVCTYNRPTVIYAVIVVNPEETGVGRFHNLLDIKRDSSYSERTRSHRTLLYDHDKRGHLLAQTKVTPLPDLKRADWYDEYSTSFQSVSVYTNTPRL
jgi:hypothetical protein